jgi:hypothetical protein
MTLDAIRRLPRSGACIRVVYTLDGLELFAIGVLIHSDQDHLTMQQFFDQLGSVDPVQLIIPWSGIVRITMNGPAAGASRSSRPWGL